MFKFNSRIAKTGLALFLVVVIVFIPMSIAFAGQPGVECDDFAQRPGHSDTAPGSAFNEDGHAGTVYAGEQPQNSVNPHSVAQYDVACEKVSQH
jgi:hypothetical protein